MNENTASYLRLINDMLTDRTYDKSEKFLKSVKDYIIKKDTITVGQQKAIQNIYKEIYRGK